MDGMKRQGKIADIQKTHNTLEKNSLTLKIYWETWRLLEKIPLHCRGGKVQGTGQTHKVHLCYGNDEWRTGEVGTQ